MRKITSQTIKAIRQYNLITNGDKIAVGVSGGKDSLVLLTALANLQKHFPVSFNLVAITIDQTDGKTNFEDIAAYCGKLGVEYHIVRTNIFEVVFDIKKEKNPCSLCAKMRRGSLNSKAKELGCNKVALAHHCDDLIETFLMSIFYEGRLSTFSPISYLSNTDLFVIRPLIFVSENDIILQSRELPIVKNICPADKHTKRQDTKLLIQKLKEEVPDADIKLLAAITQTDRYNMFDKITKK